MRRAGSPPLAEDHEGVTVTTRTTLGPTGAWGASLWAAVTLVFIAVTHLPGDPVRALSGFQSPPQELYARIRSDHHFDEALPVRYGLYPGDLLSGDWGRGLPVDPWGNAEAGPAVDDVVAATAPVGVALVLGAVLVQLVVGVVAGVLTAGAGRRTGAGVHLVAVLLVGTPVVVAAYLLRTVFVTGLGWAPFSGAIGGPEAHVLPVVALAALCTGATSR